MALEVRPAVPREYVAIGELTVDAYRALAADDEWHAHLTTSYARILRDVATRARHDVVLVAVEEGELLGAVTFVAGSDSPSAEFDDPRAAGIRMLAVAPGARRRGAGRALVGACIERARAENKARVVLHTQRIMHGALALYARFGFVRRPDLDWSPAEAVHLEGYVLDLAGGAPKGAPG